MRRRAAVLGSIAVHGAVVAALVVLVHREPAPVDNSAASEPTSIELVDLELPPTPAATSGGGGAPLAIATPTTTTKARPRVASLRTRPTTTSLASLAIEANTGGLGGDGGGVGGGFGGGNGTGIGLGTGAGIAILDVPAPPPAPAPVVVPVSKARPAKLVYPTRERDVEDGQLFIARVTVDHDGYVVGARLVRGFGGPRDAEASDLIWRFRYSPALDDDGHAIRSTLDQRFLVNR